MNLSVILHLIHHTGAKIPRVPRNTRLFLLTDEEMPTPEQLAALRAITEPYLLRAKSLWLGLTSLN